MSNNPYLEKMNKAKGKATSTNETTSKNTSNKFMSAMDKVRTNPVKGSAITTYTPEKEAITEEVTPNKGSLLNSVFGKEARDEYWKANSDRNDFVNGLGFGLEMFNRIPLTQRLMNKGAEFMGVDRYDMDGSKMETKSTGNKYVDGLVDVGGNLIGAAGTGNIGGKNLLNATDDLSRLVGGKVATKTGGKLLPAIARGSADAAGSVALEDISKGKFNELPQDILTNAVGGGLLFGGGQLTGDLARKAVPKLGNKLPDFTNDLYNVNTKDMLSDLVTTKSKTTTSNINPLNPKDMNFSVGGKAINQPKTEVATTIEPNVNLNPVNSPVELPKAKTDTVALPKINNAKIESPKDPLSIIEGISVGNVPKKEPLKVNYSKAEEPIIDSTEIKIETPKKSKDGIAEDFDVTAKPAQSIVTGTNKTKTSLKNKWESAYSRIVDVKNPIKKVNEEAHVKATNSANAGSVVESVLKNNLTDAKGNKIGDSLQKTLESNVPKGSEVDFWEYTLQRHNVARAGQEKPIYYKDKDIAYTPAESKARAEYLEKQHPEWKEKADNISKWIDDFMKEWGVKTGTIDEAAYNEMRAMYPNYIPSNRRFNDLEDFLPGGSGNGRGFVDQSTPINGATGSQRDIQDPTESIMNLVNRTIRTAKYNEVGQTVVKAVRKNPAMSGLAEILPPPKPFTNPYDNLDNVVTVLDGGKPVYLQINDKQLLGALKSINKLDLHDGAKAIKAVNTAFKALITTKNPVFAIRNVSRDIPTYLINSKENNPFKLLGNLGSASKELIGDSIINPISRKLGGKDLVNTDALNLYRANGGGGSNFLKSDATKSATELTGRVPVLDANGKVTGYRNKMLPKRAWDGFVSGIEGLNNITESAPRLAEFKNSLGRGENIDKAMFDAAEVTTNFSRGGDITKFFDVFTPYLNASVQGLDKLGRQVIKNPVQTALKGATVVTLPVLAMDHFNKQNPYYKDLDNRTKDNNILIPNVLGEKDEKGIAKTFIKIPKSREYGVLFGSLAERYLRYQAGEDNSFKGFGSTLATNFAPANPIEDNIAMPAANILMGGNKDFAGRDIVPRSMIDDGRSKYLQYDEKTSEPSKKIAEFLKTSDIAKKVAELTNTDGIDLSPKQIDYLLKSYLGVIAQLGLPLTTKNTMQGGNTREKALKPLTTQFIADPAYSNQGITDFYDKLDKSKQLAADRNILEKVDSKTVTTQEQTRNALNKVSTEMSALNKQIKEAEAKGDKKLVTNLRLKMLQLSKEANAKYNVK